MTSRALASVRIVGITSCMVLLVALTPCVSWAGEKDAKPLNPDTEGTSQMTVEYQDEKTGARIRDLTPDMGCAQVFYQTHPMWTQDGDFLLFYGERNGKMVPHALFLKSGRTRSLVDGEIGDSILDRKQGRLYYTADNAIWVINVGLAFRRVAAPRKVVDLPRKLLRVDGGLSLDSKGDWLYVGGVLEEDKKWTIVALDIARESWQMVTEVDFRVGHIQANPSITRIIMFCHETGGDAPQRTWVVNARGTGLRPFYKETYNEWVTHECWWGGTKALFTIWPYDDEHTQKPHGAAGADLANGKLVIYSQMPAWHIHGSPDGKWIVVDDNDRNLWLIDAQTNERRLLTQGHLAEGFKNHPHPSFTPDSKSVIFTSSRNHAEHVFMAEIPEWSSLPLP